MGAFKLSPLVRRQRCCSILFNPILKDAILKDATNSILASSSFIQYGIDLHLLR